MSRLRPFTVAEAVRVADVARGSDDEMAAVYREVNGWFANVYGWPLTSRQAWQRDAFLRLVLANLRKEAAR